jgi:threonine dehydratase
MMLVVSPDAVIVPIGGGGLIAGIAAYFKQNPATSGTTNVIGVQPTNDAAMWASIEAGHIVDIAGKDTLSDATAGGIEREDNITFELTKRYVLNRPLVVLLTHIPIYIYIDMSSTSRWSKKMTLQRGST